MNVHSASGLFLLNIRTKMLWELFLRLTQDCIFMISLCSGQIWTLITFKQAMKKVTGTRFITSDWAMNHWRIVILCGAKQTVV